jgi:hypothetical protein
MQFLSLRRFAPLAALAFCSPAFGQLFFDDFESYTTGSAIEGQGGWHNWDTVGQGNQLYNTVEASAGAILPFSGTGMLKVVGSNDMVGCQYCSDTVHELNGDYNGVGGQYVLSMQQYVPGSFAGSTYIIGLSEYADGGGPYNWSMQVHMDANSAQVVVDGNNSVFSPTILFDQWVEFRAEIDLDLNTCQIYYDNILIGDGPWDGGVSGANGILDIDLDLFPGDYDVTEVYYDDVSLTGGPPDPITVECDPANNHTQGNYTKLDNSTLGAPAGILSGLHLEAVDGPAGEFGYFLVSAGASQTLAISNGILCLDSPQGRYAPAAGVSALNSIGQFDGAGVYQSTIQAAQGWNVPTPLPTPPGGTITAGSTWHFQMWYRDGQRSNFSNAISVQF